METAMKSWLDRGHCDVLTPLRSILNLKGTRDLARDVARLSAPTI